MVKTFISLVVAAVALQGLAAPVFENREQSLERRFGITRGRIGMVVPHGGFRGTMGRPAMLAREVDSKELEAREPGHHVKSGVELAATVAPLLQRRSIEEGAELDAREPEPKFKFGSVLKDVGKVASIFIREHEGEDLYARGLHMGGRPAGPFSPHGPRGGFGMPGGVQGREFDSNIEIEAREPRISGKQLRSFGHHLKHGAEFAATVAPLMQQRSVEDEQQLLERRRGVFVGGHGGQFNGGPVRHFGGGAHPQPRELEDEQLLERRRGGFGGHGGHFHGGMRHFGGGAPPQSRELEDEQLLERRRGGFGGHGGHFRGGMRHFGGGAPPQSRELEEEINAREFDDAELEEFTARDPFFLTKLLKGATKVASNFIRREDGDGLIYSREFEIDELD
ncbi:hypothetical protein CPB84DRAFT_1823649 [Gymnopilus junonius]|uniref:Uncharacterized protein n=1 Tax=Gymnopilus junonius TaxID=109634 RepID=A0A9P5TQ64_GYMJU|nr:hypothetical protein CPB84DRAFT_1823649 [Gymnopilus junonius]